MALTRTRASGDEREVQALIVALQLGEREAQAELFDRYVDMIERVLFRLVGPHAELPDLVQEAFIQVLGSIRSFRSDAKSFEPWLRAVAVRTALNRLRWRRTRRWLGLASSSEDLSELHGTVDPASQAALSRAFDILDRLPPAERAAFVLRFVEGMQLREVAEACGVSLATIKRRLGKARRTFERLAGRDPLLSEWL